MNVAAQDRHQEGDASHEKEDSAAEREHVSGTPPAAMKNSADTMNSSHPATIHFIAFSDLTTLHAAGNMRHQHDEDYMSSRIRSQQHLRQDPARRAAVPQAL